jgi:hypothetical protein
MRYLIFIFLVAFSINARSQNAWKTEWLKPDKAMHITYSIFITALAIETATDFKYKNPELVGVVAALGITSFKEFFLDKNPDPFDMGANIIGISLGPLVNRVFNRWEMKHYYKERRIITNPYK